MDGCNGTNGLLQATMRNKKALRRKMDTYQSEGKAEYEKALPLAFSVLLDVSCQFFFSINLDVIRRKYKQETFFLSSRKHIQIGF